MSIDSLPAMFSTRSKFKNSANLVKSAVSLKSENMDILFLPMAFRLPSKLPPDSSPFIFSMVINWVFLVNLYSPFKFKLLIDALVFCSVRVPLLTEKVLLIFTKSSLLFREREVLLSITALDLYSFKNKRNFEFYRNKMTRFVYKDW